MNGVKSAWTGSIAFKRAYRLLDLQPYTLCLRTVKQGCVELVFEVPQHVADVIFPPTEEQLQALKEHNIRYCGELESHIFLWVIIRTAPPALYINYYYFTIM